MARQIARDAPLRLTRAEANRIIRKALHFDHGPPDKERRFGHEMGTAAVRHDLNDRVELLRVIGALQHGRTIALFEFQQTAHIRDTPAGRVRLDLFEAYLFGGAGGGCEGHYGSGFFSAIASAEQNVRSIH